MPELVLENLFNPYAPGFYDDPYPAYRRLREVDPCHLSFMGTWVMSRYDDVKQGLVHPGLSSDMRFWPGFQRRYDVQENVRWFIDHSILTMDPPHHPPLKSLLSRSFLVEAQRLFDRIVPEICDARLDRLEGRGSVDFISEYAQAVPLEIMFRLFGIPDEDKAMVKGWSSAVSRLIEPLPDFQALGAANEAVRAFADYLAERSRSGRLDLVSRLTDLAPDEIYRDRDYIFPNLILLFLAGHETTVNLLGNGTLALLRNPAAIPDAKADPGATGPLVEEMLRYDPPQQLAWRTAREDLSVGRHKFRKGDQIMFLLGAANRAPEVFADPDRFDPGRSPNRHLTFGRGPHACIGAWFARSQGRIAIDRLLGRFRVRRIAIVEACWLENFSFRGLRRLKLDFAQAA